MARTKSDLREAEGLLRRAQQAPPAERLWLLTVAWQLLHEIAAALAAPQAARAPIGTTPRARSEDDDPPRCAAKRSPGRARYPRGHSRPALRQA